MLLITKSLSRTNLFAFLSPLITLETESIIWESTCPMKLGIFCSRTFTSILRTNFWNGMVTIDTSNRKFCSYLDYNHLSWQFHFVVFPFLHIYKPYEKRSNITVDFWNRKPRRILSRLSVFFLCTGGSLLQGLKLHLLSVNNSKWNKSLLDGKYETENEIWIL